ncbi:MAG TPA: hypothetical protein VG871_08410 [Vicinamibacterales bacterium]|nr:hypothetical protein [Vicinamibacterales bacterium]
MTIRTHFWLAVVLVGGTSLLTTGLAFVRWWHRWPLSLAWLAVGILVVGSPVVTYVAVFSPNSSAGRLRVRCIQLLMAVYIAIGSSMLLLFDALTRTR